MDKQEVTNNNQDEHIEELKKMGSKNLKTLIESQGISQKRLAEITGTVEATVSNYIRGYKLPSIDFLWRLKLNFGISIDDFLSKELTTVNVSEPNHTNVYESAELRAYEKFTGTYYFYYLDTSKYKGRDFNSPEESVMYGVVRIYNDHSPSTPLRHSCTAILGIKDREQIAQIKNKLQSFDDSTELESMLKYVNENYEKNAYYGSFDMTSLHAFISLRHDNKDRALIILLRPPVGKTYNSGIGTINSVSRGREPMPTIQFIGLSRNRIGLSPEEIHHNLLLSSPHYRGEEDTKKLISSIKKMYFMNEDDDDKLTEEQKMIAIRSNVESYVNEAIKQNIFRYAKISNRDDDDWYHAIKDVVIEEDNSDNNDNSDSNDDNNNNDNNNNYNKNNSNNDDKKSDNVTEDNWI